jgi:hypothetical protein
MLILLFFRINVVGNPQHKCALLFIYSDSAVYEKLSFHFPAINLSFRVSCSRYESDSLDRVNVNLRLYLRCSFSLTFSQRSKYLVFVYFNQISYLVLE